MIKEERNVGKCFWVYNMKIGKFRNSVKLERETGLESLGSELGSPAYPGARLLPCNRTIAGELPESTKRF